MTSPWNRALRDSFAQAREMEPTDAEVQRVLSIDASGTKRRRRAPALRYAVAAFIALAVASGAYAAPPTRAALDDVYSAMTGWMSGDDGHSAPGQPLGPDDDAPAWVRTTRGDQRLVAQSGAAKLYAVRGEDETISFALGGSVGLADSVDGWRGQLAEHKVVMLGPGSFPDGPLDDQARRPLFGLTSPSVERVELRYANGDPSVQDHLAGGFVVLADAQRQPRSLVAFNDAGSEIDRVDVSELELRVCTDTRGCPPGRWTPSASDG
jgi:hypothetical protein